MDTQDTSSVRSPRRELQGPRPAPLKVRKDSHKIRKPPVAPPPAAAPPLHHAPPPRPPVIIYTVSPKIIHANPNEFMSLVQRLTGPNSSSYLQEINNSVAVSPAARFASVERTRSPKAPVFGQQSVEHMVDDYATQHGSTPDHVRSFPGILSPNPNSLPPIPPNFFSPPSLDNYNNNAASNFSHDFSSQYGIRNYFENNNFMVPSPCSWSTNFIMSPQINMPSPDTLALFNTFFDL